MSLRGEAGVGVVLEMAIPGGGGEGAERDPGEPDVKGVRGSRDFVEDSRGGTA